MIFYDLIQCPQRRNPEVLREEVVDQSQNTEHFLSSSHLFVSYQILASSFQILCIHGIKLSA